MTDLALLQSRCTSRPRGVLRLLNLLSLFILIVIWEAVTTWFIEPIWIARPSAVAVRLWVLAQSGDLWKHTFFTTYHALAGLLLSLVIGVPIGILFGSYRAIATTFETLLMGLYSLSRIALAPLFILWFGIGEFSKIMMTFSMVVFVVILNTYEGLRGIDMELVDMMRAMRARPYYILQKVRLPGIVPWILASLRVGIGLALVVSVIGELLGANRGLGWYIEFCAARLDVTGIFAGLVVLMVLGMVLNEIVRAIETHLWLRRVS